MNPRAAPLLLALGLLARMPAQTPVWDPDFHAPGLGGRALTFATWRNELYAGGLATFMTRGGPLASIARFDGARWLPLGSGVDAARGDAIVRALVEWNGELVAAGRFATAGGQPASGIARWDGTTWRPFGSGLGLTFDHADVHALAVFNQQLYACGQFDLAGGRPANGFARWDGSAWHAVTSGFLDSQSRTLAIARAMLVANGKLWVGGDFDEAGGIAAAHVAAFDGTKFIALGSGTSAPVVTLESFGGEVIAGGQFTAAGGQPVSFAAGWNGVNWHGFGTNGPRLPVNVVRRFGTQLWAGGHFVDHGPYLARWDGTTWSSAGGVSGVFAGITTPFVWALHEHLGRLVVGGEFTRGGRSVAGPDAVASVGAIATDGAGNWFQLGAGLGVRGVVRRIVDWRGSWIAIGNFEQAGASGASHLVRFDGDAWRPLGRFDGEVSAAVVWRGDLLVSGAFASIDGRPIPRLARFDGATWQPFGSPRTVPLAVLGNDLYAGGTNELLRWNGSDFAPVAATGGIVAHLHAHVDGRVYVVTTSFASHRVLTWDGSALQPIGAASQPVHCIGSHGSDVVIGGRFSSVGGVPANLIARWSGSAWSALPGGLTGYAVDAIAELDGVLHIGANGDPRGFSLRHVGGTWQPLGGPEGLPVSLFADRAAASLWAGGSWNRIGTMPAWNFGVWRMQPAFRNRLHGLGGAAGVPLLLGRGALQSGTPLTLGIEGRPQHLGLLIAGATRIDAPAFGGTLVPSIDLALPLSGDAQGRSGVATTWPVGFPPGLRLHLQAWLLDATAPQGLSATNALECTGQ